ncbi:type II secretion system secretin GspD [Dasania sp. GY-MA-18]|uniref:Type II secretion system secretin GspD n=1 Tax=Dasania phycosphaerae TaxID=2950436 RepID=A0A9J6RMH5_9GAMM|nr:MULTISPECIES: type II secretion system secretin GspD [Dasania]MCR8923236.1 type II secretion system secretin GspD [Dasania sp. GY-MA-18]MCZ0865668.1 type II secretion system secretin GspD [Dasania phycosphaerae]MCZ0869393.1 type II secretion system secretin GspD [Dasania phycosphaerae]
MSFIVTLSRRVKPCLCLAFAVVAAFAMPVAALEKTWTLNSKEMDIQQLIISVAKATDKTIIIDPKVKGKVQVVSSKPLNREQYYNLFLTILDIHGFAAIENSGVVRVVPTKDARSSPVPVELDSGPETSEVITQVIQLENISAAKLIPVLRPLAPQQSHMAAYAPSNAIIISDTRSNILRIQKVIQQIDRSAQEKTEIVTLEHAAAEEVVKMLEKLQKREQTKGQPASESTLLVADKRTNSLLINGDELERQRIKTLIKYLDTPLIQSGNVKVVYLEYAEADELAKMLSKVIQNIEGMSQQDGVKSAKKSVATVEADIGTNALIITADADVMQSLLSVVQRLDIRRAQVLVEAIIVEMSADNGQNLGVEWLFSDENGSYGSSTDSGLAGALGAATSGEDSEGNAIDPTLGLAAALSQVPGQVLGVGRLDKSLSFNVVLNALKTNTQANILSTPSLLTLDNEEASIVVGQSIPFVTGSYTSTGNTSSNPGNPFQTVERENVGITLKVTPQINEGDSLILALSQEVSDAIPGSAINGNLITTERKIDTKILADNGQTIVLGGLIKDNVSETQQKVPLLGDIPFLGALFRSTKTTYGKTHLLVFLRSSIIRDNREMDEVTAIKYKLIRKKQLERIEGGVEFVDQATMPLLPEWQEQLEQLEDIREQQRLEQKQQAESELQGG